MDDKNTLEIIELKRRVEALEASDRKRDDDIRQLFISNKGIEVMQTQIMSRFDSMESKVFNQMAQIQSSFVQSQQQIQQQSQQQIQTLQDFVKQIVQQEQEDRQNERENGKSTLQEFIEHNKMIIGTIFGAIISGLVTIATKLWIK